MSQSPLPDNRFLSALKWRVVHSGLRPAAILALESGRPLALLAAQLVWLSQPLLSLVWRSQELAQWARFLEEPRSIDKLLEQLETEE